MTKHLLILHRDALLRQSLSDQLVARGFTVKVDSGTRSGADAHDLAVADDEYFAGGAESFAVWVQTQEPPVLMLTQASEASRWLSAGAAACLVKPIRFGDLLQRIESLISDPPAKAMLQIGRFHLSAPRREIVDQAGKRWPLTEKEAAILLYLHAAGARSVPRDELLESVWRYATDTSTHTVETHIYRLRQKLAQAQGGEALLVTDVGGYRLMVE